MGAVTKKIKEVSQPQITYQAQNPGTTPPTPTPEEQAADARRKNLLGRDRGRYGTIRTGFRGLMTLASSFGTRKTLLGE